MKFLHISDLHLGKILHNLSLVEGGDQSFWLEQLLHFVDTDRPDAVLISGDVYDRGVPPKEATLLLDRMLTELAGKRDLPVLMIAGNHDGGERLNFGADLLRNVYLSGLVSKELKHVTFEDEYGPVTFWLMPYIFPAAVRELLGVGQEEIPDYDAAARALLAEQRIDFGERNVLLTHQFIVNGKQSPISSDSESTVGGVGAIDYHAFDGFDYVALGHIHGAQAIGRDSVRYAGAPLCYHFSEIGQKKGILSVSLGRKGSEPEIRLEELPVLHGMRNISGAFEDIVKQESVSDNRNEYVRVVLTDEEPVYDAADTLRSIFEAHGTRMLDLAFEPQKKRQEKEQGAPEARRNKPIWELFEDYYYDQKGQFLSEKDSILIRTLSGEILNDADKQDSQIADDIVKLVYQQEENA